jgi:phosphoribosylanthranilate isomerase
MTRVKLCGITNAEDARLCAEADYLGLIFVPGSPRHVTNERAREIVDSLGRVRPRIVGVFRDQPLDLVKKTIIEVGLDVVQLHGAEPSEYVDQMPVSVIKTIHVGETLPELTASREAAYLLFDTLDDRLAGGTGRRFDWGLVSPVRQKPFFLAGGITPENVGVAISVARPFAIDVASGVEASPGRKDPDKVRALLERVRAA